MIFYKTSSFGNDFIEIAENDFPARTLDKCLLVRDICDGHRAVGADGVVFYSPCRRTGVSLAGRPRGREFNFQIYNRDGGEAELSGNGMAGLAAVLFKRGLASSPLRLNTKSGPRHVALLGRAGPVFQLQVEIGLADFFNRRAFPFLKAKQDGYIIDALEFYPVAVGNPHAVVICRDRPDQKKLTALGEKLESHSMFPGRVNVEFVYFTDSERCRVFFYERGVGPTMASSTGSAAVFAVLRRLGMVGDRLLIDCGTDKIAVTWKQGIYIDNFTRLICRGNYFV